MGIRHEIFGLQVIPVEPDERSKRHQRHEPAAHEHLPAVHRAEEMRVERHRLIPRDHAPAEAEDQCHEHRELALQRVRGMQLAALLTKRGAHARADTSGPAGTGFRRYTHIESHRCPDIPKLNAHDDEEHRCITEGKEAVPQPQLFFVLERAEFVPPRIGVLATEEQQHQQAQERDRQKCDIALEEADHAARPTRGGNALYRNKHHRGRGNGGEEQPVHLKGVPGPVVTGGGAVDENHEPE